MGGSAHEHAIKTFKEHADITIFCWTEYNRIYHKKYSFNFGSVQEHLLQNKAKSKRAFLAANAYYQYLHDQKLAIERQIRDLFWFDQEYTHITNLLNDIEGWYFDETDNFIYQTAYITALENVLSQLQREED